MKVPKSIKQRVIKQWLQGISRDQIAKDNGIGTGTVSAIIKDAKKDIPDIDLLREVALVLKSNDLDLVVLADSIRLKKKLDDMDLSEEEFVNVINKAVALSKNLGIPVDQLANYILEQQLEFEELKGETEDAETKQLQVLRHYNINMDDLEEYRRNKPLVDRIRQLKEVINNLVREIKSKEFEITTLQYKYMTGQQ